MNDFESLPAKEKKAFQDTIKVLKKIRAQKGKLQGNFYWTGTPKKPGPDNVSYLVALLSYKDPKGTKTKARGKQLLKKVKKGPNGGGAKFAQGIVGAEGRKLFFEIQFTSGAQANDIRKNFKQSLSKVDGLEFLKKAAVYTPSDGESRDKALGNAEDIGDDEAELSALEAIEAAFDLAAQGSLAGLNKRLGDAFAKEEGAEEWTGGDPFDVEEGGSISETDQALLVRASDGDKSDYRTFLDATAQIVREIHAFSTSASPEDREKEASKLLPRLANAMKAHEMYTKRLGELDG